MGRRFHLVEARQPRYDRWAIEFADVAVPTKPLPPRSRFRSACAEQESHRHTRSQDVPTSLTDLAVAGPTTRREDGTTWARLRDQHAWRPISTRLLESVELFPNRVEPCVQSYRAQWQFL